MTRTLARRLACWTLCGCVAIAAATTARSVISAEDKDSAEKAAQEKERVKPKKGIHRLPPHYGGVVDDEQRAKIYKIQDEYQPKIEALEAQLKNLRKERDGKIEALLTPEQKQKIDAAKAQKKAGKEKAKAKKPAD